MESADFDPAETIAGFPLLSIKRALVFVGIMDDRDDIKLVAEALSSTRLQAEGVLGALERRGLVAPTGVRKQWTKTALGWRLAMHWKLPPRLEPVIALEDETDSKAINEMFGDVPCSILRAKGDDDAFEEARLEVGVFVDYASPRVIEISVSIPDDYDHPDSSAIIESSVYIGVDDAKRFAKTLQTAIDRAESELERRSRLRPAKKRPPRVAGTVGAEKKLAPMEALVATHSASPAPPKPATIARAAAVAETAKRRKERAAARTLRLEEAALNVTTRELKTRSVIERVNSARDDKAEQQSRLVRPPPGQ